MPLKELKLYKLNEERQASYIPILDEDPVFAARFLTKEDLVGAYKLLKECFEEIKKDESYYEVLRGTIMSTYVNFIWFASMLREMEILLDMEEYEIPYERAPQKSRIQKFSAYNPFQCIRKGKDKKISLQPLSINVEGQTFVNNHRIFYIAQNYDMEEFQDDVFPAWYLLKETTVFEQYNEKTNTRVRIEFIKGEFQYYISGASDNWQLIEDVPLEMDSVVSALLFRKL